MSEQITARPYHKNPRKISAQQVVQLREWLAELGDLGGIVHDLNSGEIISGNQRSFHAFDLAQCEIEITHRLEEPDAQGTVAHGFVLWQGGRYAYRQVRWTAEQCEKANIIANKAGGVWDIEMLLSDFEREGLLAWGFSGDELEDLLNELTSEHLEPTKAANDPYIEWNNMLEFEQENSFNAVASFKVHIATMEDLERFSALVDQTVTTSTNYIWFPKQQNENLKLYRVVDDES